MQPPVSGGPQPPHLLKSINWAVLVSNSDLLVYQLRKADATQGKLYGALSIVKVTILIHLKRTLFSSSNCEKKPMERHINSFSPTIFYVRRSSAQRGEGGWSNGRGNGCSSSDCRLSCQQGLGAAQNPSMPPHCPWSKGCSKGTVCFPDSIWQGLQTLF